MSTIHGVATPIYYANMFLFAATIGFGTAFIVSSVSANFFKWELSNCMTKGEAAGTGRIVVFSIDMEADIGWRDFTVTYLDQGAQDFGCFKTIEQGEKYPIGDYQVWRSITHLLIAVTSVGAVEWSLLGDWRSLVRRNRARLVIDDSLVGGWRWSRQCVMCGVWCSGGF